MTVSQLRELLKTVPHQANILFVDQDAAVQEESVFEPLPAIEYVSQLAAYVIWVKPR